MSERGGRVLPLDARVERQGQSTIIRIPLRCEELRLEKQTFVTERIGVRPVARQEVAPVTATVAREELAVETSDALDETRRLRPTTSVAAEGAAEPPRWANRIEGPETRP